MSETDPNLPLQLVACEQQIQAIMLLLDLIETRQKSVDNERVSISHMQQGFAATLKLIDEKCIPNLLQESAETDTSVARRWSSEVRGVSVKLWESSKTQLLELSGASRAYESLKKDLQNEAQSQLKRAEDIKRKIEGTTPQSRPPRKPLSTKKTKRTP